MYNVQLSEILHLKLSLKQLMDLEECKYSQMPACNYNHGQKVLGTVLQYAYFSVISRFPLKTVHHFRNFLAVLSSPTLYKVETQKKFWIHAFNIVCGVRGGV